MCIQCISRKPGLEGRLSALSFNHHQVHPPSRHVPSHISRCRRLIQPERLHPLTRRESQNILCKLHRLGPHALKDRINHLQRSCWPIPILPESLLTGLVEIEARVVTQLWIQTSIIEQGPGAMAADGHDVCSTLALSFHGHHRLRVVPEVHTANASRSRWSDRVHLDAAWVGGHDLVEETVKSCLAVGHGVCQEVVE